ncbi:MAG TPA: TetR/AcrR family transcriptional regulator [Flavobacteriales bacterium]|nr:TetR/AcrR family transcriptional regulator [Flavobacteriales bacterium]
MKKKITRREESLLTLLEIIAERGIQDAPMSLVAERSGIAIGTIYHHFKSKDEMVEALYCHLKAEMGDALNKNVVVTDTIKQQYFTYWHNLYKFYRKNASTFYFLEQCDKHPIVSASVKEANFIHYGHIYNFLETGMKAGVLRKMDTELMLSFIYGTVVSTVHAVLNGRINGQKAAVEQVCQSSWDGVKIN